MVDIQSRKDIDILVKHFYQKAMHDDVIGHFFSEVAKIDLAIHVPKISDFWESILLGRSKYKGNPMEKHIELHSNSPINEEHFVQWLALWNTSVSDLYEGPVADEALSRARQIAGLMQFKIQKQGSWDRLV